VRETVHQHSVTGTERALAEASWQSLVAGSRELPPTPAPTLLGAPNEMAPLPVAAAATASTATALRAAGALGALRNGTTPDLSLHRAHAWIAAASERHFSINGQGDAVQFAPISRFWRARDGWVRTHGNFSWHRDALLAVLDCDDDPDAVAAAISGRTALDLETAVMAAGGVTAAVRTIDEWDAHPQGRAVAGEPLVSNRVVPGAAPRPRAACELVAGGVRVLDLTRVIAGPVCTRYLAAVGADVVRVDPPDHRDAIRPGSAADTLYGKRSAFVDLATPSGREVLEELLDGADVVVCGYRPGALDRFGFDADELVARHPGLVVVVLNAWGHHGPWAARRGFDSVVQAPTGIGMLQSVDAETPGALPFQLLDHGTGYLAAAAALDGLRRQATEGGTHVRGLSLARTARWLTSMQTSQPSGAASPDVDPAPWLQQLDEPGSTTIGVAPPGSIDGVALRWSRVGHYGADDPSWST
jgi:hypothetical protein